MSSTDSQQLLEQPVDAASTMSLQEQPIEPTLKPSVDPNIDAIFSIKPSISMERQPSEQSSEPPVSTSIEEPSSAAVSDSAFSSDDEDEGSTTPKPSVNEDLDPSAIESIRHFYAGRFVFITGATGFLGKVLIEKLLYSCPEIAGIYMLARPKRGKSIDDRVNELLDSPLFDRIRNKSNNDICDNNSDSCDNKNGSNSDNDKDNFRSKLKAIPGDVTLPNLGISDEDEAILCRDVSVVIHSAATIRFDEPIKDAVKMNVDGALKMFRLCERLPRLVSLVHVSTAYANCDRTQVLEAVYPPPLNYDNWLQVLQWLDDKDVDRLTGDLIGERPNTYTYTKSLAEHFLTEEWRRHPLPLSIVRPSIVGAAWREPKPGWVDNFNGPTGVFAAVGSGILRKMKGDNSATADIVPVDHVVNVLIAAGWYAATRRPDGVIVYNAASGKVNPIKWGQIQEECIKGFTKYPLQSSYRRPKVRLCRTPFSRDFTMWLKNIVPAYLGDAAMSLMGMKPKLLRLQDRVSKAVDVLEYFTCRSWEFDSSNVTSLRRNLTPEEQDIFEFDVNRIQWDDYMEDYIIGTKRFALKESQEEKDLDEARKRQNKLVLASYLAKFLWFLLFVIIWRRIFGKTNISSLTKRLWKTLPGLSSAYKMVL